MAPALCPWQAPRRSGMSAAAPHLASEVVAQDAHQHDSVDLRVQRLNPVSPRAQLASHPGVDPGDVHAATGSSGELRINGDDGVLLAYIIDEVVGVEMLCLAPRVDRVGQLPAVVNPGELVEQRCRVEHPAGGLGGQGSVRQAREQQGGDIEGAQPGVKMRLHPQSLEAAPQLPGKLRGGQPAGEPPVDLVVLDLLDQRVERVNQRRGARTVRASEVKRRQQQLEPVSSGQRCGASAGDRGRQRLATGSLGSRRVAMFGSGRPTSRRSVQAPSTPELDDVVGAGFGGLMGGGAGAFEWAGFTAWTHAGARLSAVTHEQHMEVVAQPGGDLVVDLAVDGCPGCVGFGVAEPLEHADDVHIDGEHLAVEAVGREAAGRLQTDAGQGLQRGEQMVVVQRCEGSQGALVQAGDDPAQRAKRTASSLDEADGLEQLLQGVRVDVLEHFPGRTPGQLVHSGVGVLDGPLAAGHVGEQQEDQLLVRVGPVAKRQRVTAG